MARQLSIPQRISISLQLDEGKSYAEIARTIGVHRSTVKREIDRNSFEGAYCPQRAHSLALHRKTENGKDCTPPLSRGKLRFTESRRYHRMLNYLTFRRRLALYYRERYAEAFRIRRKRKRFYFYTERFISRSFRYKLWKRDHNRERIRTDYRPLTFLQKLWKKYRYVFTNREQSSGKTIEKIEQKQSFRIERRKLKRITYTKIGKKQVSRRKPVTHQQKHIKKLPSGFANPLFVLQFSLRLSVHALYFVCPALEKHLWGRKIRPPIKTSQA